MIKHHMGDKVDFFTSTQCLFCRQSEDRVLYPACLSEGSFTGYTYSARRNRKREHYRIVVCKNCLLVRSDPVIQEEKLQALYAESQFIFSEEAPYAARTYARLLEDLRQRYHVKIQSLLEIGCSTGFFLEEVLKLGIHDVMGFEPSLDCYRHAKDTVRARIINDIYKPERVRGKQFDVVCSFHVLDHLRNPQETVASFAEVLNPGGYVIIVCHDVESWSAKLLDGYSPIFDVEHIYLFSTKTLARLLERCGFKSLEGGSLANTYPLGYWLRMVPGMNTLSAALPAWVRKLPITLKAGNLYLFAQKG